MSRAQPLYDEPEWAIARAAFRRRSLSPELLSSDVPSPDVPSPGFDKDGSAIPAEINGLLRRMDQWETAMVVGFDSFESRGVSSRLALAGALVAQGLHLRADLDTEVVAAWLQNPTTSTNSAEVFVGRRQELADRLNDLAVVGSEVFRRAEFLLPSEVGHRAWYNNAKKLAQLLGGRRFGPIETGLVGVFVGGLRIAKQERPLLVAGLGRQLRTTSVFGWTNRRRIDATNRRLRRRLGQQRVGARLDYSRGEQLRAAYRALKQKGVAGADADLLIDESLKWGQRSSGKPWRGLIQLRELITHAEKDPTAPGFVEDLQEAMTGAIHYSHTPGKEWLVRDFTLSRALLKADGKTCRTTESVAVSQSGASIVPGVLANNPAMLGLAAHYMKPIQVYLNGVVAQSGSEHRRHKNVFQDFFKKGEVLDRAEFIEQTVASLLDDVEAKASGNDGRFDFKTDLAFNFPIRIICDFMGIPVDDAAQVQHWSEASVRALDASAGLSLAVLSEGNRSAAAFLDYLGAMVERCRQGEPVPGIIGAVANTTELNDIELASNLAGITFAGFETTTGLLSLGFMELLQHRQQFDYLRSQLVEGPEVTINNRQVPDRQLRWYLWAHDERKGRLSQPDQADRYLAIQAELAGSSALTERLEAVRRQEQALGRAVEELLRWTAPGSVIPLTLEEDFVLESPIDTKVGGCPIASGDPISFAKGQTITVDVAAANRSGCPFGPGRFEQNSGDFDISRTDNTSHLSFGVTHICMGADLAVENAKRMIEGILRRMPDLALDGRPDEHDGNLFIGLETLPVRSELLANASVSATARSNR